MTISGFVYPPPYRPDPSPPTCGPMTALTRAIGGRSASGPTAPRTGGSASSSADTLSAGDATAGGNDSAAGTAAGSTTTSDPAGSGAAKSDSRIQKRWHPLTDGLDPDAVPAQPITDAEGNVYRNVYELMVEVERRARMRHPERFVEQVTPEEDE